ncbi:TolC family protein [Candidatus Omnitrophota bacterium]
MKKITFLVSLIFLFLLQTSPSILADQTNKRKLALEEFIRLASGNDTVFQEILINELALQYQKALQLPAKDLVLSVRSHYSLILEDDNEAPENTVSLSKLFPYTATKVSAEYSSSLRSTTYDVSSGYSIEISQPIAENAFGKATRLLDRIVGMETDIARYQIVEAYESYLATIIQKYYEWYSAYENLKTAQNSYTENVKLLENIQDRRKNNIALPIDVNKVQLQVFAKEENLIALRNIYLQRLNAVKEAIRYPQEEELLPQLPTLYMNTAIAFSKDYQEFKDTSRTYKVLEMIEKKSSLELDRATDALLPSIDLFVGFSVLGEGYDVNPEEKKAFGGLELELPLPGQVEKAEYGIAKIEEDKTALSNKSAYARLYTTLKDLHDSIEREKKLIAIADEKVHLAEEVVKDETENYSYGKSSLNDLIDEINKLDENNFSKIIHMIQLRKLIVEWLRLTDRLVLENEVLRQ